MRRRRILCGSSCLGATVLLVTLFAPALPLSPESRLHAQASTCRVTTGLGDVQGVAQPGACAYLGVPYAASPIGNMRWRPPQPRAPWAPTVLNATVAAPICFQINLAGENSGNEDCLTLNIWTPAVAPARDPLPVMVWLHPGAFVAASSNFPPANGRRFAAEAGAVVVAPNYRLGAFGFLSLRRLAEEDPGYRSAGNYGLADQRAALQWVRDHIAAFGGDPNTVTLAGTSAGGISTGLQLVSPGSRGLFQRAIIQSGSPTTRLNTAAEAEAQGEAFAAALDCPDGPGRLACLRGKTREQVLRALMVTGLTGGPQTILEQAGRVGWDPVVDGLELPDQPRELYRRGLFARIPLIIGRNRDEGWTFVDRPFPSGLDALQYERVVQTEYGMDAAAILRMYPASSFAAAKDALAQLTTDVEYACEVRRLARFMHHDGAPVYVYSLEYAVDAVTPGRAYHGLDMNLLFGNNFAAPSNHVLNAQDLVVFNAISTYWRRFMETGDPNPRGVPVQWPPYRPGPFDPPVEPSRSDAHFVFGDRLGVANYLRDSACNFWEPFFFRTVVGAVPATAR